MTELPTGPIAPPTTEEELLRRADGIAGRTLGELAAAREVEVPADLRRNKGWVGQLIEQCLGASAGNLPEPDFVHLGIELKTLPVDRAGRPLESTYVCHVPLTGVDDLDWEESTVFGKLHRVLWVPVQAERELPLAVRMVGQSVLWSPSVSEAMQLRRDWESHVRVIAEGYVDNIRGGDGDVLQIRPKGADASVRTWGVDERGEAIMTSPRGFYLRTLFTEMILRRYFGR